VRAAHGYPCKYCGGSSTGVRRANWGEAVLGGREGQRGVGRVTRRIAAVRRRAGADTDAVNKSKSLRTGPCVARELREGALSLLESACERAYVPAAILREALFTYYLGRWGNPFYSQPKAGTATKPTEAESSDARRLGSLDGDRPVEDLEPRRGDIEIGAVGAITAPPIFERGEEVDE